MRLAPKASGDPGRVMNRPPGGDGLERFRDLGRTADAALRDELITSHLGLAHRLARRFAGRGEPHEDLVQVASVALVKAVDRFDPERGVQFSTFAATCVIGELKRHFRDRGWAVRAPRRIQELYLEVGQNIDRLSQELGHPPTVAELAAATGASEDAVLEAIEAGRGYRTASLDAPDANSQTMADSLGSDDARFDGVDDRSVLRAALEELPERDRVIIHLRFIDGLTQSEIATRLGLSQMHVSRLLAASLKRLRTGFADDHRSFDA
jgi:RNA polymerase sigma-B factor